MQKKKNKKQKNQIDLTDANIKRSDPAVFIEENLVKIENNTDFSYHYIKSDFLFLIKSVRWASVL